MSSQPVLADPAANAARQRKDGHALVPGEAVLWEGSTWPCWPCCCIAPLFCYTNKWTVTTHRIDKKHGCCGFNEDTLDVRRITDLSYRAARVCCCCYGAVEIYSGDNTSGQMTIETWFTHELYVKLKEAVSLSKAATAVEVNPEVTN